MDTNLHGFFNRRDAETRTEEKQLELDFSESKPFPPILTLREFVAQMERDYGSSLNLDALRGAMEEPS